MQPCFNSFVKIKNNKPETPVIIYGQLAGTEKPDSDSLNMTDTVSAKILWHQLGLMLTTAFLS